MPVRPARLAVRGAIWHGLDGSRAERKAY